MINICNRCGNFVDAPDFVKYDGISFRRCNHCSGLIKFHRRPIIFLTGASGVGKSTIGSLLTEEKDLDFIPIESDILWNDFFNTPGDNYRKYRETWLRLCKNINQGGKPVLLIGCLVPDQIEPCYERQYFSDTHYIALFRSPEEIRESLLARLSFRNSGNEQHIREHLNFNKWLFENANYTKPRLHIIDSSGMSIDHTREEILAKAAELLKVKIE